MRNQTLSLQLPGLVPDQPLVMKIQRSLEEQQDKLQQEKHLQQLHSEPQQQDNGLHGVSALSPVELESKEDLEIMEYIRFKIVILTAVL